MSATRSQCDARLKVTFPATRHHCPLAGTKLYCLVTEARVCVLTDGYTQQRRDWDSNLWPVDRKSSVQTTRPPSHNHTYMVNQPCSTREHRGCSSPSSRHWARRWRTTNVCDAGPVRRQTYGYLPSHKASSSIGWYQIILLGDRDCPCL